MCIRDSPLFIGSFRVHGEHQGFCSKLLGGCWTSRPTAQVRTKRLSGWIWNSRRNAELMGLKRIAGLPLQPPPPPPPSKSKRSTSGAGAGGTFRRGLGCGSPRGEEAQHTAKAA
eukprot:12720689-Alexandrium_andersonii.AAC.1